MPWVVINVTNGAGRKAGIAVSVGGRSLRPGHTAVFDQLPPEAVTFKKAKMVAYREVPAVSSPVSNAAEGTETRNSVEKSDEGPKKKFGTSSSRKSKRQTSSQAASEVMSTEETSNGELG